MSSQSKTQSTSKTAARLSLGASLLALTLGLGAGVKAHAQAVTTAITPTQLGQPGFAGTEVNGRTLTVTNCATECSVTEGRRPSTESPNLFHSFTEFDLAAGHSVRFFSLNGIRRIIVRVTGNAGQNLNGSDIFGGISVDNAPGVASTDFYFINPQGVTFGPGASVDVPGTFYVTAADRLLAANGSLVLAANAPASELNVFSSDAPARFGFLEQSVVPAAAGRGGIRISGPAPSSSASQESFNVALLHVSGRNVALESFNSQALRVFAVGNVSTEFGIDVNPTDLAGPLRAFTGTLQINRSFFNVLGGGADFFAGDIEVRNSVIDGATRSEQTGAFVRLIAKNRINVVTSFIDATTFPGGDAGAMSFEADTINLIRSVVSSNSSGPNATGDAGEISLFARRDLNLLFSQVLAAVTGGGATGNGGDIVMRGDSAVTLIKSTVATGARATTISSGAVNEFGRSLPTGNAGNISVQSRGGAITIAGSTIESAVQGVVTADVAQRLYAGRAGEIVIGGPIDGVGATSVLIRRVVERDLLEPGGTTILPDLLAPFDESFIIPGSTQASVTDITPLLAAERVTTDGSGAAASPLAFVRIIRTPGSSDSEQAVDVFNTRSTISTKANAPTRGPGAIRMDGGGDLQIVDADITSATDVDAAAKEFAENSRNYRPSGTLPPSPILPAPGLGPASSITLSSAAITLANTTIDAKTRGVIDAGAITLASPGAITLTDTDVTSSTTSTGIAGRIQVGLWSASVTDPTIVTRAGVFAMTRGRMNTETSGAGRAGSVLVATTGATRLDASSVTSSTTNTGNAGLVRLDAGGRLILENGADVTTSTTSTGQAGAIRLRGGAGVTIAAGEVDDVTGLAQDKAGVVCTGETATGDCAEVSSAATGAATGAPGTVEILADGDAVRLNQARLSTEAGASVPAGAGSSVTIANTGAAGAERIVITNSRVSAQTEGARDAGAVTIATPGAVTLTNATIASSTTGAGNAGLVSFGEWTTATPHLPLARIASLTMIGGEIITSTTAAGEAGQIRIITAGPLRMQAGARIESETSGAGEAGQVSLDANGRLIVAGGAQVRTNAEAGSTGKAGAITLRGGGGVTIAAGAVDDAGQTTGVANLTCVAETTDGRCAQVSSQSAGTGGAGAVTITADTGGVQATQALISTQAGAGVLAAASPGAVTIRANGAGAIGLDRATVTARTLGAANAGAVTAATTGAVTLANASVTSTTAGAGAGGNVTIGDLTQRVASLTSTGSTISSTSSGSNTAGSVRIVSAGRVAVAGGTVESQATGTGAAGLVDINATMGGIAVNSGARISTEAGANARDGAGATVTLNAGTGAIDITGATVTAETKGSAKAGDVALQTTGAVTLTNAAVTSTTAGAGAGGGVTIGAFDVGGAPTQRVASLAATGSRIASSSLASASGQAGSVRIVSAGRVTVSGGTVESEANGTGSAGGLLINAAAGDIVFSGGARVSTEAGRGARDGAGSNLTLDAGAGAIEINNATVTAETKGAARAGLVTLLAGKLTRLLGGARVSSETDGAGAAGGVTIQAAGLEMRNGSVVTSSTDANNNGAEGTGGMTGQAGDVTIVTRGPDQAVANPPAQILLTEAGTKISTESGTNGGAAGRIDVNATGAVRVVNGARITTETRAGGASGSAFPLAAGDPAGTVRIKTGAGLWLEEGGAVSTSTIGTAKAGDIIIDGPLLSLIGSSLIQASTAGRADAGNVRIGEDAGARPGAVRIADGGQINTNVTGGAGVTAGSITLTIAPGGVLELKDTAASGGPGTITTSAARGAAASGGSITISGAKYILSDGGVIQATGDVPNARANIAAQAFVSSADRRNVVLVDGVATISGEVDDPARGTEIPDVGFLDASAVLNDQCLAVRADGVASVLATQPLGPRPRPAGAPAAPASCAAKTDQ